MSLRKRLAAVSVAIVMLSVALTALVYSLFESGTNKQNAKNSVMAYSHLAVSSVEMRTDSSVDELVYIAVHPLVEKYLTETVIQPQKSEIYSLLALYSVSSADLESIYITDAAYTVHASTNTLLVGKKCEPIKRQRDLLSSGQTVLAEGNKNTFTVLAPVMSSDGEFLGCVGGTFSSSIFDGLTSSITGFDNARIIIMDATGVIVSSGSSHDITRLSDLHDVSNITQQIAIYDSSDGGKPFFYNIDGKKNVAYVAHLNPSGWSVISACDYNNGTSPVIIAVIIVLAAGVAMCWFISAFVAAPMDSLMQSVNKLTDDAYGQRLPHFSGQEFGAISTAFNKLLAKVEADHKELLIKEKRHRIVNELSNSIIFEYNIETGAVDCSPNGAELADYPACFENFPLPFVKTEVVHRDDAQLFSHTFTEMLCGRHKSEIELRLQNADGSYKWYQMLLTTIIDDVTLRPLRIVGKLNDIDDDKRSTETLKYQASRDSLTGIYNKGATHALIQERLEMRRADELDAMLIMDIDNFKRVNDGYGHQCGDRMLKAVASEIASTFRTSDIVGRMGGDEFMVMMCDAKSRDIIEARLQSLKGKVNKIMLDEAKGDFMSLSVGVAVCPDDGREYSELYSSADAAVYHTKQNGKNGHTFFDKSMNSK